jgi:hypothetical protein
LLSIFKTNQFIRPKDHYKDHYNGRNGSLYASLTGLQTSGDNAGDDGAHKGQKEFIPANRQSTVDVDDPHDADESITNSKEKKAMDPTRTLAGDDW